MPITVPTSSYFLSFHLPLSPPPAPTPPPPTPLIDLSFRSRLIYLKRDDLLHLPPLHANKARKLHTLLHNPPPSKILSYGGPHSNNMLALASVAKHFQIPFHYITRPQPSHLSTHPGNFLSALDLGMNHHVVPSDIFRQLFGDVSIPIAVNNVKEVLDVGDGMVVPQGGAWPLAEQGIKGLALELKQQIGDLRKEGRLALKKPVLFLAAGTGTTAYYLNKHLGDVVNVVAVPVSGDETYLIKQMRWLGEMGGGGGGLPGVLRPRIRGRFGDIREDKLKIWKEMERTGIDFDLVYAPKAWEEAWLAIEEGRLAIEGEDLIYYHSGGCEGNVSMLERFKQKGLL